MTKVQDGDVGLVGYYQFESFDDAGEPVGKPVWHPPYVAQAEPLTFRDRAARAWHRVQEREAADAEQRRQRNGERTEQRVRAVFGSALVGEKVTVDGRRCQVGDVTLGVNGARLGLVQRCPECAEEWDTCVEGLADIGRTLDMPLSEQHCCPKGKAAEIEDAQEADDQENDYVQQIERQAVALERIAAALERMLKPPGERWLKDYLHDLVDSVSP